MQACSYRRGGSRSACLWRDARALGLHTCRSRCEHRRQAACEGRRGRRTARPAALARRFLLCASTLLGVSPVSSLLRLDVLLSSSLLCVLRGTGAHVSLAARRQSATNKVAHFAAASSSWHLRLSVEFLQHTRRAGSGTAGGLGSPGRASRCAPVVLYGVVGPGGVRWKKAFDVRPWATPVRLHGGRG